MSLTRTISSRARRPALAFLGDEDGATAIEYCLIAALIFLAIVTAVNRFADANDAMYEEIATAMSENL